MYTQGNQSVPLCIQYSVYNVLPYILIPTVHVPSLVLVTSQIIHHRGASLREQCIAVILAMVHKLCITAGFVTVCCCMSVIGKTWLDMSSQAVSSQ